MKRAFALLFLLGGCAASTLEYDKRVFSIQPDVELVSITQQNVVRERDNEMFVQVQGQPASDQTVFYKIQWYDKRGMEISTTLSKWKKVNLKEGLDFNWKMTAPGPRAVSYKIYIAEDIGDGLID